jgi:hypothetical protein
MHHSCIIFSIYIQMGVMSNPSICVKFEALFCDILSIKTIGISFWDHEISIIVASILTVTVLTVFRRKLLVKNSLLIMEIMAIHSWKSQYIKSVWFWVMIYCVIC